MKRNGKRIAALLSALVLALTLCACAQNAPASPSSPAPEANGAAGAEAGADSPQAQAAQENEVWHYELTKEAGADEYKADDGTVLASCSIEHPILIFRSESGKTFSGHLPNLGVTEEQLAVAKTFNDKIAADVSDALEYFEDVKGEAKEQYDWKTSQKIEFMPLVYEETVERSYQQGDLLSALSYAYVNLGGAHPDWNCKSWNFDLAAGEFFTPNDLSDDPAALRKAIADHIVEEIYVSEYYDGYYDDFEEAIRAKEDFDACFGEDGMTVFFEEYEIAPHALGIPQFTIPHAELARFLNARGERLLAPSAEDKALGDFYEAEEMWYWFEGGMPVDETDTKTTHMNAPDGDFDILRYRVDIPGVKTGDDLLARLRTRFSEELARRLVHEAFNQQYPLLAELDGVLYAQPAGRGTDMYIDSVDYRAELDADGRGGRVLATIHWQDYDEDKQEWQLTGETSEVAFPFTLTDGGAVFTEFQTIW